MFSCAVPSTKKKNWASAIYLYTDRKQTIILYTSTGGFYFNDSNDNTRLR